MMDIDVPTKINKMTREEKAQYCIDNHRKSPAFQFYPDNWWGSRHVAAMDSRQRGIHASLIFSAWLEKNCGIPENEICLSARIPECEKPIAIQVLSWCWFLYENHWFCERLLDERIKQINLSSIRTCSGSKGGRPRISKIYKQKPIANQMDSKHKPKITKSEEEDEDENTLNLISWRNSFPEYQKLEKESYLKIYNDKSFIEERQKYHPNLNIILSIQKAHIDFWSTEAGWKNKKSTKTKEIDWEATYRNALTMKCNQVWISKNEQLADRGERLN